MRSPATAARPKLCSVTSRSAPKCSRSPANIRLLGSKSDIAPSEIYRLLEPLSLEVVLFIMSKAYVLNSGVRASIVTSRIKAFLARYNGMRTAIRGDDLKAMGLKSGPVFKKILDKVLYGKIDGKLKNKDSELEYAHQLTGIFLKRNRR